MSEKAIETTVCAWLAFQGYIPLKVGLEGWPDRLVVLGMNQHLWFEFKTEEGKLRPQQVNRIQSLKEIGEVVHVVTSLEEAQSIIEALNISSPLAVLDVGGGGGQGRVREERSQTSASTGLLGYSGKDSKRRPP